MNDCSNAEIRDQLPDLVHERLDTGARSTVLAHVEDCGDCRDELQLLRDARAMFAAHVPRVDVAYVVGGLPKPPAGAAATRLQPRRRTWSDWRVAAAVTLLVAGGGSYVVMNSGRAPATVDSVSVAVVPVAPAPEPSVTRETASTGSTLSTASAPLVAATDSGTPTAEQDQSATDIGSDSRIGDLNEAQLQRLLQDVGNLRPVPVTEPAPVTLGVSARISDGM